MYCDRLIEYGGPVNFQTIFWTLKQFLLNKVKQIFTDYKMICHLFEKGKKKFTQNCLRGKLKSNAVLYIQ